MHIFFEKNKTAILTKLSLNLKGSTNTNKELTKIDLKNFLNDVHYVYFP